MTVENPYTVLAASLASNSSASRLATLKQWLVERVPGVDVEGPVVNTLLLYPLAERQTAIEEYINTLRDYSLLTPLPVESIADDDLRESIRQLQAQELGLEADAGLTASGVLRLTFGSGETRLIPSGTQFQTGGLTATVTQAFRLRSPAELNGETGIVALTPRGNTWVANIPVVFINAGNAGNVPAGTVFSSPASFVNLLSIAAAINFVGGRDAYTIASVVDSYFDNRIMPSMGARDQIVSLLRTEQGLGDVKSVGVVGFGDPEMHRDKIHFIPGGSGRTDLYIAGGSYPSLLPVSLVGQPITRSSDGGQRYAVAVGRDVAPGFLQVEQVRDSLTGTTMRLVAVNRGIDVSPMLDEQVPNVSEISQATFSRYQTATVIVEDTGKAYSPSETATRVFEVDFLYQPGIDRIQSLVSRRSTRYAGGDTLVRSAIPLLLAMQIRMRSSGGETVPEAGQLQAAVLAEISRQPMRSVIYLSDIVAAISPFLRTTLAVQAVDFYASYVHPDGRTIELNSRDEFRIPLHTPEQLSPRTIAIYTSSTLIRFSVEQLLATEIP